MDNNSMFWNRITEWFKSHGLPYITEFEVMLIFLAAFLILLVVLWLIFRKARLWYWKTDIQVETLKSIDARLHIVEEKLSPEALLGLERTEKETSDPDGAETSSETAQEKEMQEYAGLTAIGKSGKVYTEAELELQIRE